MPVVGDPVRVVLASASPRRRTLLADIGIDADVIAADVDETIPSTEDSVEAVLRLARAKADVVCLRPDVDAADLVIAADTIVVVGGEALGKPTDRADARSMLRRLSGRDNTVLTGVCVRRNGSVEQFLVETTVRFRELLDAEIDAYVASGEADDKAGAYGVQGAAGAFVTEISGSFSGLVGLPLVETVAAMSRLGVAVHPHR